VSAFKYKLREVLPSLVAEARQCRNPEIKQRFYLVKAVVESEKDIKKVCESRGVSRETFYKWGKKLLTGVGLRGLESKSRRPKTSPKQASNKTERAVCKMKKKYSFRGPDRISFHLRRERNIECPPSTVYAILKRAGLISKKYRQRKTKKHMRRYRRPILGYLQLDIKYVPYKIEGKQYYQWSVVDHHSSWRFIRCYKNKALDSLNIFLEDLEVYCPFEILQIQTDNDMVFTDKFWTLDFKPSGAHDLDQWCKRKGIEHKLIPPGLKELNGKVENTHKYDDEEFYSQHDITSLSQLERLTEDYNFIWNEQRYTKKLGWQTPFQVVKTAQWLALGFLIWMRLKYPPRYERFIETAYGKVYCGDSISLMKLKGQLAPENKFNTQDLEIKTVEGKANKTTKLTHLEKYLRFLEWDDKNNRSVIFVSPMSPIFSSLFFKTLSNV